MANGFSRHAGVSGEAHQRPLRARLCRSIARPAAVEQRPAVNAQGKLVYLLTNRQECRFVQPKAAPKGAGRRMYPLHTPYREGTTAVAFDPRDFISRPAALALNHRGREQVTPARPANASHRPPPRPHPRATSR